MKKLSIFFLAFILLSVLNLNNTPQKDNILKKCHWSIAGAKSVDSNIWQNIDFNEFIPPSAIEFCKFNSKEGRYTFIIAQYNSEILLKEAYKKLNDKNLPSIFLGVPSMISGPKYNAHNFMAPALFGKISTDDCGYPEGDNGCPSGIVLFWHSKNFLYVISNQYPYNNVTRTELLSLKKRLHQL